MKNWIEALRSGWKAGLRQYRKRRTELARGPVVKGYPIAPAGPQELSQ